MEYYNYIKSLHIIFVVTWFAGLFYIVRLFVYHHEAAEQEEPAKSILIKQYQIMEKRLWHGITWPSMIGTLIFGFWMLYLNPGLLSADWMLLKLFFVLGLILYHIQTGLIFYKLKIGILPSSSNKMRVWNEVATLFLVTIVFIVILKNTLNWIWGLVGLIIFSVLLMLAIRIYKRIRQK